jgi:hypothetical protein
MKECCRGLICDTIPTLTGGTKEYHKKKSSQLMPQMRFERAASRKVRSVTA